MLTWTEPAFPRITIAVGFAGRWESGDDQRRYGLARWKPV
jgi:hypothetical protein